MPSTQLPTTAALHSCPLARLRHVALGDLPRAVAVEEGKRRSHAVLRQVLLVQAGCGGRRMGWRCTAGD